MKIYAVSAKHWRENTLDLLGVSSCEDNPLPLLLQVLWRKVEKVRCFVAYVWSIKKIETKVSVYRNYPVTDLMDLSQETKSLQIKVDRKHRPDLRADCLAECNSGLQTLCSCKRVGD